MGKSINTAAATHDGWLLRTERSREAIVQALFDLVGEGTLQPTAEQVAKRASAPKDQAASFDAWDRLRSEQRLVRHRAEAAMRRGVLCLVDNL